MNRSIIARLEENSAKHARLWLLASLTSDRASERAKPISKAIRLAPFGLLAVQITGAFLLAVLAYSASSKRLQPPKNEIGEDTILRGIAWIGIFHLVRSLGTPHRLGLKMFLPVETTHHVAPQDGGYSLRQLLGALKGDV